MPKISFKVDGLDLLIKAVSTYEEKVIRPAVRRGVSDATKEILWAARRHLKGHGIQRTGALYQSLGRKVKVYRDSKVVVVGIVGPRVDTADKVSKTGRAVKGKTFSKVFGKPNRKERRAVPARYVHLVEFGTRRSKPKPFLRPAYVETQGKALAIIRRWIAEAVKKNKLG